jgi:diaminopropionate ammonia-lyase family
MIVMNPLAVRGDYPPALRAVLDLDRAREMARWLEGWSGLRPGPTPLRALPGLAARLGLGELHLKDESCRSPLGSFKALGAPAALVRLAVDRLQDADPQLVLQGHYAGALRGWVVISATDGNHGRALAAAARSAGCRCVIVLHAHVGQEREDAIAALGAEIVRVPGDYDASVREAQRLAAQHGWQVVSDTSYEGYEQVPRDVMQGYALIAAEVMQQAGDREPPFTHVVLQGGVGGFAAAIVSAFWQADAAQRPAFIVVEPVQADCLAQSALAARPAPASGSVDSVMAGLACGETSPLAWRFLQPGVEAFVTVEDEVAVQAMRILAQGSKEDPPVLAGESGAAGVAALLSLAGTPEAQALGLDRDARVLAINTEGATAPQLYASLVGRTAAEVLAAQAAFLQGFRTQPT